MLSLTSVPNHLRSSTTFLILYPGSSFGQEKNILKYKGSIGFDYATSVTCLLGHKVLEMSIWYFSSRTKIEREHPSTHVTASFTTYLGLIKAHSLVPQPTKPPKQEQQQQRTKLTIGHTKLTITFTVLSHLLHPSVTPYLFQPILSLS
jgi:hypothetical protein